MMITGESSAANDDVLVDYQRLIHESEMPLAALALISIVHSKTRCIAGKIMKLNG